MYSFLFAIQALFSLHSSQSDGSIILTNISPSRLGLHLASSTFSKSPKIQSSRVWLTRLFQKVQKVRPSRLGSTFRLFDFFNFGPASSVLACADSTWICFQFACVRLCSQRALTKALAAQAKCLIRAGVRLQTK